MPRYHFRIAEEPAPPDEDGIELPDDGRARELAVVSFGEMLRDLPGGAEMSRQGVTMDVTTDNRLVVRLRLIVEPQRSDPVVWR